MNIGLIGRARVGKDTVGAWLVEHRGYERVAFADELKAAALRLNPIVLAEDDRADWQAGHLRLAEAVVTHGWERVKDELPETRRILQELGASIRAIDPEFWLRAGLARVAAVNEDAGRPAVITDVRYPNEAESLRRSGFHLVYINRPDVPQLNHESEGALGSLDAHFVIENDGSLGDLAASVHDVWHQIHTAESARHYARSLS